jgi:tetrahydromethanopterin S-methyltransferase subunit G
MTCVLSCNSSTPQVAPKREKLLAAQGELSVTMSQLAEAQAKLKAVEEKMEVLQAQYMEATGKKEGLAKQVRVCVMQGLCIHLHPRTLHQIYLDL